MVEDKMTRTERCYRDDYLTSVDGYVQALANLGKINSMVKDLNKRFSTEWEGIKLRFSFSTPKTCTMKYKTVRKKVDQIETDSNGDTYVLEDVFDGYDCSEKSMITALKEQE